MNQTIEEYESSSWWKSYTHKLLSPSDVVCEICGKPHWMIAKRNGKKHKVGKKYSIRRFATHHKHYKHPYAETREDVMVLCNSCHETGHKLADLARNPLFVSLYEEWQRISGWESERNDLQK